MKKEKHDSSLNTGFLLHGEFWLPGKEQTKVAGVIEYKPRDLLSLTTIGSTQLLQLAPGKIVRVPLVVGFADDRSYYYLVNSQVLSGKHTFSADRLVTQIYHCQYVVRSNVKTTWSNLEDIKFHKMSAGYYFLSEWLGHQYPFQNKPIKNHDGVETGMASMLSYPTVDTLHVPHIDSELITSYRGNHGETDTNHDSSVTTTLSSSLDIKPSTAQQLDWFIDNFYKLNKLLILLFGRNTFINYLGGKYESNIEHGRTLTSTVFLVQSDFTEIRKSSNNKLFVEHEYIPDFGGLFSNWLEIFKQFKNPINLFVTTVNDGSLYDEFQLLALSQSFETFHREFSDRTYMDKDKYETTVQDLYKAIPTEISGGHRSSLKNRIKYGYEYSLRNKIKQLLEDLGGSLVVTMFTDKAGLNNYIDWVVNTRNYHTHYDNDPEKPHATGQRLNLLIESMECCLFVVFLNHLGIESEDLIRILDDSKYKLPIDLNNI